MVALGRAFTVTTMAALELSPQPVTWLTYQVLLPTVDVFGVGGIAVPVPPVAASYHIRLLPVADKGTAGSFWQIFSGEVTPGAMANAFTTTCMVFRGPSQPFTV